MDLIRRLLRFIMRIFRWGRKKPVEQPHEPLKKKTLSKWWQFPFRFIDPSRGFLPMPKRQPAPCCGSWAKRTGKTIGGANYYCTRHHVNFFVRYPHATIRISEA